MKRKALCVVVALWAFVSCKQGDKTMSAVEGRKEDNVRFVIAPELTLLSGKERPSMPSMGAIPNAETAARVAFEILCGAFGRAEMTRQLPLLVNEVGDVWIVRGAMLPAGMLGGTGEVALRRSTGEVLYIVHGV